MTKIEDEIIDITQDLVRYRTFHESLEEFKYESEVDDCLDYIEDYFSDTNLHIQRFGEDQQEFSGETLDPLFYKNPKPSLVVSTEPTLEPKYMLHGHVDVVPPQEDNYNARKQGLDPENEEKRTNLHFEPLIEENKMYGRGTADMKLGVASLMKVMKDIDGQDVPPTSLMIVTDEEQGGFRGAGHLFQDVGYNPDFTISAEPSDTENGYMVVYRQKGNFQLDIEAYGEAVHGSRPWEGECANRKLINFLNDLEEKFPDYTEDDNWYTTLNIGNMEGGHQTRTTIPDKARAELGIRFTQDYTPLEIMEDISDILGVETYGDTAEDIIEELNNDEKVQDHGFKMPNNEPMQINERGDENIQELLDIVEGVTGQPHKPEKKPGASDARFTTLKGGTGITFGPRGFNLHGRDEYADLTSIEPFYQTIRTLITRENR